MTTKDLKDLNQEVEATSEFEQSQQGQEQNGFDTMLPSISKLIVWLIYITGFGMVCFPYFAFTIDPKFAIHFWILTGIDFGLFLALLKINDSLVGGWNRLVLLQNENQLDQQDQQKIYFVLKVVPPAKLVQEKKEESKNEMFNKQQKISTYSISYFWHHQIWNLFLKLNSFKRFVVSGNTLSQGDEDDDKKQDVVSSENNNSSKKQQNPQKKNKKKD